MTWSTVGVNLGTFCYPLVDAVWGAEGLTRLVLFDAVNQWSLLVFAPLLYASAVAGKSFSPPAALANVGKQLTSPCMLALFVGVALQVLGWSLPSPVVAFTSSLAAANKPLALLALGILFDPVLKPGQLRDIASLLCLRYGASLLLGDGAAAVQEASAEPAAEGAADAAAPAAHVSEDEAARSILTPELARMCAEFVSPDRGVHNEGEALAGAMRILSDRLGRNPRLRGQLRQMLRKHGVLSVRALVD